MKLNTENNENNENNEKMKITLVRYIYIYIYIYIYNMDLKKNLIIENLYNSNREV